MRTSISICSLSSQARITVLPPAHARLGELADAKSDVFHTRIPTLFCPQQAWHAKARLQTSHVPTGSGICGTTGT